jgi:hypothetical protein
MVVREAQDRVYYDLSFLSFTMLSPRASFLPVAVFLLLATGVARYKQPACDEAWFIDPLS